MMKASKRLLYPLFFTFSVSSPSAHAIYEWCCVYGYTYGGYSGSTDMGPLPAAYVGLASPYSIATSYGKERMEEELRKEAKKNCESAAKEKYSTKVTNAKIMILSPSAASCASKNPANYLINQATGALNSYTDCLEIDKTTYKEIESMASKDLDRELAVCNK